MKNIFIILASLVMLSSCEKVVDLELDNSSGTLVIEGNITDAAGPHFIKITKSVSFTETNTYPPVTGATVVVTDNLGQIDTLTYVGNGNYKTNTLLGITGRTYNLKVIADGKTYTATSTMPAKVNLDTLRIVTVAFAGQTNYNVIPVYVDPSELGNNYQFSLYKNGVLDKGFYLNNDNVNNGLQNQIPLRSQDIDFKTNDIALVEMRCIDLNIYNYYFTLSQIAFNGPGGGTTPSNPPSNISNGALGIFSAHTVQRKSIKIN
jgi:Domain of unknown function (DUF4249)